MCFLTWLLLVIREVSRIVTRLCFRVIWEQSCTRESPIVEIWPVAVLVLVASSFQGIERWSVLKIIPHLSFNSGFKTA